MKCIYIRRLIKRIAANALQARQLFIKLFDKL